MKVRLGALATLPLLLSSAAFTAAQVPTNIAPPPLKMGLWQSTVSFGSSASMGPMGRATSSTNQSCYTPDSWKNSMQAMQNRQEKMNCTTSNFEQDSHQISFDGQCSMDQGMNVSYHVQMMLDSDSAMHGTTSSKISGPMLPQAMTMSSSITSKFVSSDCGSIKPGESKAVHP